MHGTLGAMGPVDLKNLTFWSSTIENMWVGMCHTFIYPDKVAADMMNDAIYFSLNTNLRCPTYLVQSLRLVTDQCFSYKVYLHDPKYHYLVRNPLVSPRIFRHYKDITSAAGTYEWLYITVTEHRKLNRKTQPCEVKLN